MTPKDLLLTFIDESQKELQSELQNPTPQQGNDFFRKHYFELEKEFKNAPKLLSEDELKEFYFHYCRMGDLPKTGLKKTYDLWEDAYKRQVNYIDKLKYHYKICHWTRIDGLVLFGYDDVSKIDENSSFEEYFSFYKMFKKIGSYTSIPGMLKKAKYLHKFAVNERFVNRLSLCLKAIDFIQDSYWSKKSPKNMDHNYSYLNLNFWGIIYVLVLSDYEIAKNTITEFKKASYLPFFDDQMEILQRFEIARDKFLK